jgi:hypothetical protein
MGCTKCSQKKELENSRNNEIIYNEPEHNKPNLLKRELTKNFILESLNSQIMQENQHDKEIPLEEQKKLIEIIEKIKVDKKKMRLLQKCQSHLLGMQLRKKLRVEALKKSETINLDLFSERELPMPKEEIIKFFDEYPQKKESSILKVEKKEPVMLEKNIIYYGEWDMNFYTKHGRGIQIWPDGSYYKGYWENNKAEGKGEFKHSSGNVYIGYWRNNKRHGKGFYHSRKGMEYNGYWRNDKQEGKGKEIWEDGTIYNGYYLNGKKHGKGEMIWANKCNYKGSFENGNINGRGIYIFSDQRKYKGDFVNNYFEGKGTFTWPNGNKYHGNFKKDKRNGFGIFTFSDGRIYKGIWKNGKQEGEFNIFIPKKGIWIKKKFKEIEDDKSRENNKILINEKSEENENETNKIIQDEELEDIGEIKKTEENKIDELDEDEFKL